MSIKEHEHHHEHEHDHCACGHEHEHDHCDCGHDHEHEHDHCDCGHDHEHEHDHHSEITGSCRTYLIEGMDCANCAAKMEQKINVLPTVELAVLTYSTKQLKVAAADADKALMDIRACILENEPEWQLIVPQTSAAKPRIYTVEGMDCANCAAKVERKINALPTVESAVLTYSTKQLRVFSATPERALSDIRACIAENEPEWQLIVPDKKAERIEESAEKKENQYEIARILAAAALLVVTMLVEHFRPDGGAPFFALVGYVLVGGQVLRRAAQNLKRGQVFDENFLMSIATLGAFVIGDFAEALGVMLFYRVGEYFEDRAVERSRSNIMDALDLRPEVVTLVANGTEQVIPAEEAQVGDVVRVIPGDRIPLDGVVVSGSSQIDTSAITGESVPVSVRPGERVVSGCVNNTGVLEVRVEAALSESMVSRILNSVENAAASKPQIDRFITRFARIYTPVVVTLAFLVAVVPSMLGGQWLYWIKTACTFLVISCPCALVLSVPLAFFAGIGAASHEQILFKGGNSMEMLGRVKVTALDKTGTITEGNFVVQRLDCAEGVSEEQLLRAAAMCEMRSNHPIALSVCAAAKEHSISVEEPNSVREIAGRGVEADGMLCGSRRLLEEQGIVIPELADAPGCTEVLVAGKEGYLGRILISDTVKTGAAEAIAQLKLLGITPVMLTGDGEASAKAVAQQVGIDDIRPKLLPQDKLSAVEQLRGAQQGVLFVGDGINDAPVLAGADVGGAMGSGADAAIEAADLVFMTGEPGAIPKAVRIARQATAVSRQNVIFALVIKALVMVAGVAGFANMWLAVFADTGVAMLCVANSIRILYKK